MTLKAIACVLPILRLSFSKLELELPKATWCYRFRAAPPLKGSVCGQDWGAAQSGGTTSRSYSANVCFII